MKRKFDVLLVLFSCLSVEVGSLTAQCAELLSAGAGMSWITEGSYASDRQIVETEKSSKGLWRLLDGQANGSAETKVWGTWGAARSKASFIIDLGEQRLVSKIVLWSAEEKGWRGCGEFSVALSQDGKAFTELAKKIVPPDIEAPKTEIAETIPLECLLEKSVAARYVRIVAVQNRKRMQMVLGEAEIWGGPIFEEADLRALSPENNRPFLPVALRIDGWSSGAATLEWGGYPLTDGISKWRVYDCEHDFTDVSGSDVRKLAEVDAGTTSYVVHPLKPGVRRYYAVTAVREDGEMQKVKSVSHEPVGALEVRRFRDMLGFNFYWGGGGANSEEKAYYDAAADFLVDIGIRRIRWWMAPEWAVRDQYLKRGIEVNNWTGDRDVAERYGLYLHDIGNEPEYTKMSPAQCVEMHRKEREKWKDAAPEHKFYGPVVNINEKSFNYLKAFIEAGGAQYVDAIDLHTYCNSSSEFVYPKGYPFGSPEAIIDRVRKVQAFLKEKGVEKPLTCSEWGFPDSRKNPHMENYSPLRKAQFLVRGCIIHHCLGFRRLYIYSFYDEGTDHEEPEQTYGVVSRDCQKKPAYFALKTMNRILGDTLAAEKIKGLEEGDYGIVFRNVDGPGCVSVVWNGARDHEMRFKTQSRTVRVVSLFGEEKTLTPESDGTFCVKVGASVTYLVANDQVEGVKVQ